VQHVRRGIVEDIHRGSRGFITKYLAKNVPSDLVKAMRNRYSIRGEFRGYGQRVAAFGFVGVGVASGAQWYRRDGVNDELQFDPFYETVKAMFMPGKSVLDRSLTNHSSPTEEPQDILSSYSLLEQESSFVLLSSSTFVSPEPSVAGDSDVMLLSDDDDDFDDLNMDFSYEKLEEAHDVTQAAIIEEAQASLVDELQLALQSAESQRSQLRELSDVVLLFSAALAEYSDTVDPYDDIVVIEEAVVEYDSSNPGDSLTRALTLVSRQARQLDVLREAVLHQQKQLVELERQTAGDDVITPRNLRCKRDACCGPGSRM